MTCLPFFDVLSLPCVALGDRHLLPEISGIYFAIDSDNNICYVGRSQNIKARWRGHHREPLLSQMKGVRIAWHKVDDHDLLPSIEEELIELFKPLLNNRFIPHKKNDSSIFWKMHEVMRKYKISVAELAEKMDRKCSSVSRLKNCRTLPAIGSDGVVAVAIAITKLLRERGLADSISSRDLIGFED